MCYNCGCGMPNDDMGKGKIFQGGGALTEDDLKHLAEKWKINVQDVKKNIYSELKKQLEKENN